MCGIVVGLTFGQLTKEKEDIRQKLLRYFTTELMIRTEERGKDATGAAILYNDGKYYGAKRGQKATDWLATFGTDEKHYGRVLKIWREHNTYAKVFIGHCRKGTGGSKEDNENNHPIKIGNLVGIHNGMIHNDDVIFKNLGCKRDGKVDSEAIFRLFEYYTNKGKEPFTMDMLQKVVNRIDGQFAITLFNADNPYQVPIFRDGRPVELIYVRDYGLLFIVSELKFWTSTHYQYERLINYNPDLFGTGMPSIIGEDHIEKKMLPDDSGIIFDLTLDTNENTKIDDLGEWKKLVRTDKKWKRLTSYNSTSYGRSGAYSSSTTTPVNKNTNSSSAAKTYDKSKDDDTDYSKKMRVFDNIKKKYVIKVGDKEVTEDRPIVIPVKNGVETKDENNNDIKGIEDEKVETTTAPTQIKDSTKYEDVIDITTDSNEGTGFPLVEIDMSTPDPEIVKEAEAAFKDLPREKKFFTMERLLDLAELRDEQVVKTMFPLGLINRINPIIWKLGYTAAKTEERNKDSKIKKEKNPEEKLKKQEKHIADLRAMVMYLAKFYSARKSPVNPMYNRNMEHDLIKIAEKDSRLKGIKGRLSTVFSDKDKCVLRDITNVLEKVDREQSKVASNSND